MPEVTEEVVEIDASDRIDPELHSKYEMAEGSDPHPDVKHEPRTIVRSRNDGLVQMMTEIDDGVFVAWVKCAACAKAAPDCTCKSGPQMPAYIEQWRNDRFDKSLRWGTKLMKQAEKMRQGWTLVEIRGGSEDHDSSDNVVVLKVDWDDVGDEWEHASDVLDELDRVGDRLPAEESERIRTLIEEIWPDEVATRNGDDGTSGQDRDFYTDEQDRENYTVTNESANEDDPLCGHCGRDNRNGTHDALQSTGHLSHAFDPTAEPGPELISKQGARELNEEERNLDVGF